MTSTYSLANTPRLMAEDGERDANRHENLILAVSRRAERIAQENGKRLHQFWADAADAYGRIAASAKERRLADDAKAYATDAAQRGALMLDILRERAARDAAHEAAGTPPVLIYKYEVVLDGKTLSPPCNKVLLKILPPEGVEVDERKRPFMIVDPRAGHGAGIGGFKPDSQVGVALHNGHPVYFVVFRQHPEPGQTLADVMHAEAEFVAEIGQRHPEAEKPVVVGNCQGGWATMIMAACNPEITGPIVINGAPISTWSGRLGENAMRYNGGLLGGGLSALLFSDLNDGEYDGANLVSNFELLNPGRNYFGKYYDVFAAPEKERERFLVFEKWWGGYQFLNEQEIHWIVEELFIGNKLARGEARLEHGVAIDLKRIRSPIVVFASFGDNITPPQQALNWILDTYVDEEEIKILGQRIVYMVHDKVGHLGIFVSSSIAKKEHAEVTSTVKTIEDLPPGLYEMTIDEVSRRGRPCALHRELPRARFRRHSRLRRRPRRRARLPGGSTFLGIRDRVLRDLPTAARPAAGHEGKRRIPAQVASGTRLSGDFRRRQSPDEGSSRAGGQGACGAKAGRSGEPVPVHGESGRLQHRVRARRLAGLARRALRSGVPQHLRRPAERPLRRALRLPPRPARPEEVAVPAASPGGSAKPRPWRLRGSGHPHAHPARGGAGRNRPRPARGVG